MKVIVDRKIERGDYWIVVSCVLETPEEATFSPFRIVRNNNNDFANDPFVAEEGFGDKAQVSKYFASTTEAEEWLGGKTVNKCGVQGVSGKE